MLSIRFSNLLKTNLFLFLSALTLHLLCASPAFAQHVNDDYVPQGVQASAQGTIHTINVPGEMRPGVRYTTGYTETSGWENTLVKGNPNLARWTWTPTVSYTQSTGSRHTQKGATAAPPIVATGSHYVKPNHAALPLSELQVSAIHSANKHLVASAPAAVSRDSEDLSGTILPRTALSYGPSYGASNSFASRTKTDVHGVIRYH